MHPLIAQTTATDVDRGGAGMSDFSLDPGQAADEVRVRQPDLVFLTSPNNPTGSATPLGSHRGGVRNGPWHGGRGRGLRGVRQGPGGTALALLPRYPRLVVVRTMSKAFALAGARIGYLAADPAVVTRCCSSGCLITCPR